MTTESLADYYKAERDRLLANTRTLRTICEEAAAMYESNAKSAAIETSRAFYEGMAAAYADVGRKLDVAVAADFKTEEAGV